MSKSQQLLASAGAELHYSIYFPHAEGNESSEGGKTDGDAKAAADAPETTTAEGQDPSSADKPETLSKQDDSTDKQPEAKKIKPSQDTAETADETSDEDWQKIERHTVPHKVTIEDVVDESEIASTKV